jgi:hypothetical protein
METQPNPLDNIIHSATDALLLGCLDQLGQITYRQAQQQAKQNPTN